MDNHYQSEEESIEHADGKFRPPSEPSRTSSDIPHPPQTTQILGLFSPVRFLIITIGGIFLAEVVAMIVVYRFTRLPYYLQTIIDATIMGVMIFPLIYKFSLKPLIRHIEERRRGEEALRKSEERFARAFQSSPAALTITRSKDGGFIDVNEGFLQLFGYDRAEVIGHSSIELGLYVNPTDREYLTQQLLIHGGVRGYETTARIKSGELRSASMSAEAIELDGEACILASITDITERKRSQERLQLLNRSLKVLSKCNEVLVRAESETELLDKMCEIIVEIGGYRMAWVGFAEQDAEKTVSPVSRSGFEDGYLSLAKITWDDTERGRGPTGTAVRTGITQVNQNFLTNPNTTPWRASALQRGYQSSIALPLKANRTTFGALTIYSDIPDGFNREEVDQLSELASDMAYGITALRDRAERKRAEEQVREMALFPALNPDAVLQVNATGLIKKANPAAVRLGLFSGAQLTELIPDLLKLDLEYCITSGLTLQIPETRLYDRILFWTIRGEAELGLALFYSTDITELKQAEEAIHRLSRIVEQADDTVVVTDREGVMEYVNASFERLTGYTREEALGLTPRVLKSGHHDVRFYRELWDTILKGEVFRGELANCTKNGELFYEMKTIAPLRDAHGNITHFVATGKDVTRHKLDEEKLLKAYSELEQRVRDRTEELQIANSELADEIAVRTQAEAVVQQYAEEMRATNQELTRFNTAMVGRELRMIELKKEVNELCSQAGQSPRYPLDFEKLEQ
jgi:PAS domain S-box-containing protein